MTYSFGNMKLLPRNNSDATIAVSVEDQLRKNGFLVYPNPATDRISVRLSSSGSQVDVYSAQGRQVFGQTAKSDNIEMYVGNWAPGLYRIQVRDNKGLVIGQTSVSVVK
jgi:hypothetical protein